MPDWRPAASCEALEARAALLARLRAWFAERDVLEVETPLVSGAGNSDPNVTQFVTTDVPGFWLRTSPEYAMKRLLAAGSGDIYELGRAFRRGEAGRRHNPEFTLLEWYRLGWDYQRLMREVEELVRHCGNAFGRAWTSETTTYRDLFGECVGLDPLTAGEDELEATAVRFGIDLRRYGELDRDGWLDLLMSHVVQPSLVEDRITLVRDFPASQAALARIREGPPAVAERFEVFIGRYELANGYQELTDAGELRARFEAENRKRRMARSSDVPLDSHLLEAMAHGLPECSGVALGVDRLLMACRGAHSIGEVIAFPTERA